MKITLPLGERFSRRALWMGMGLILSLLLLAACGTRAPEGPQLRVQEVWSRPAVAMNGTEGASTAGGMGGGHARAGTGAVYLRLVNEGREADRLVAARTEVAEVVEIHETRREGDVMRMQHLPQGLEIPATGTVLLEPGGYHVMLIGLRRDLNVGDRFSLVLTFEKSEALTVQAQVRQP